MATDPNQIKQMQDQMQQFEQIAERFASYADQGNAKYAESAKTLAGVYDKVAREQARLIDLAEEQNELIDDFKKKQLELNKLKTAEGDLDKESIASKEKELRSLRDKIKINKDTVEVAKKELDIVKQTVKELSTAGSLWGKISKSIGDSRTKLVGYLLSTDAIVNGLKGVAKAAQDVADIQIMSGMYGGMSGNLGKDLKDGTALIYDYSKNQMKATAELAKFGISAEESGAAFKQFSTISDNSADRMRQMTEAAGGLSKVLGVSMPETVDYITEQQLKFNRTAEQSAAVLSKVYDETKKYNQEAGTQVIRGRDVVKVLFDISHEGKMVVQEQQALEKMLTGNLLKLQAQGQNYQEALAGATMFVKKMTTEAPEWGKILAGKELREQFGNLTKDIPDDMINQLNAAAPGLANRVKSLRENLKAGKITKYDFERQIQELLQGTQVGMSAMNKQVQNIIQSQGKNATQAIKAIYGVSDMEASKIIEQSNQMAQMEKDAKNIRDPKQATEIASRLKLSAQDVAHLQKEGMTDQMRQGFLQDKMNANATAEIKAQKAEQKKIHEDQIAAAKEKVKQYEAMGDTDMAEEAKKQVIELEGKPLDDVTDQMSKDTAALTKWLGGGFLKSLEAIFKSPFGQIATGIAGLGMQLIKGAKQAAELGLLAEIAANTAVTAGTGAGKASGLLGKGMDLGKKGLGAAWKYGKMGLGYAVEGTTAAGLAVAAGTGAAIGAVGIGATSLYMGKVEREQNERNRKTYESTRKNLQSRIEMLKQKGGQDDKVAKLQKVLDESDAQQEALEKQYTTGFWERSGALVGAGDLYKGQPTGGATAATPVSAAPVPAAGAGGDSTPSPGAGGSSTPGAMSQTAQLVSGSQGTDIMLMTRIPVAQAMAANMSLMNQKGVGAAH